MSFVGKCRAIEKRKKKIELKGHVILYLIEKNTFIQIFCGRRRLVGYSPWSHSGTRLSDFHFHLFKYLNKYVWLAIQIFGGRAFQVGGGGTTSAERDQCV